MTQKAAGEALAQLIAEKANPKYDVWYAGTGDAHLQAAEQDVTEAYQSPLLPQLHDWARTQAERSKYRTVGLFAGVLGFGYNRDVLGKKNLAPRSAGRTSPNRSTRTRCRWRTRTRRAPPT